MADPVDLLTRLDRELTRDQKRQRRYSRYFEGEQPLAFMAPALEAEIGDRITQLVINWPRLGTEAYEHRLDITGFDLFGEPTVESDMAAMWGANDGLAQSQLGHLESLIGGRAYVIVGSPDSDDDAPIMTVEHASQVMTLEDPRTRLITAAAKRWRDDDKVQWATLYLPASTTTYRKAGRDWVVDGKPDEHQLGEVPVVPLVNRHRLLRQLGISEFHDIIPIADAANKMATDMMISGEFHAMPRRWVVGMTQADFVDENDQQLSTWSAVAGRIWGTEKKPGDVQFGQFTESDLAVFHNTIKLLAQLASQMLSLPQDYMSFTSDNPVSADAMRASETRLIKTCERKQSTLTTSWKRTQRLLLRFQRGNDFDPKWKGIEVTWRDPATPTKAQAADATVKLHQAGILPLEQAREDLGYTDEQRKQMAEMDKAAAELAAKAVPPPAPVPVPQPA